MYLSHYIYLYPFILSLHISLSTSLSTHQSTPLFLSVYTQCVALLLGNMYKISTRYTFCQQSTPKHQNIHVSTTLNTVTRVPTSTRISDTCRCIYTLQVVFVSISRVCTSMCAACSYRIMAVRIVKHLIIPFPCVPVA